MLKELNSPEDKNIGIDLKKSLDLRKITLKDADSVRASKILTEKKLEVEKNKNVNEAVLPNPVEE